MSKLYSYGCSFSWNMGIEYQECFPVLVSNHFKLDLDQQAFPALCNDEIYSRFLGNLDKYKEGDIILYQFTFPARKGFLVENSHYESSAGFFSDTNKDNNSRLKTNVFANQKVVDYLYDNVEFIHFFNYFTLQRVVSVLQYIEKSIGIRYRILFITEDFTDLVFKMNEDKKDLRVDGKYDYEVKDRFFIKFMKNVIKMNEDSLSISDYVIENNLTVDEYDKHPGVSGHKFIADKIIASL